MMKSLLCRVTTVIALGTWAGGGLAGELDSSQVVSLSHIAGGLVALPNAKSGDEKLALELARRPAFVVHLTAQDKSTTSRLRATGETAGILGKSLYVEQGQATALPFADRLVDLIVATDLRDADLTPELKNEWLRILSPGRGSALAGRSTAAGPGLTAAALKAWTRDIPNASVTNTCS